MDSIHMQCEELLRQAEKLLRDADAEVASTRFNVVKKRRRNAINAACNALHRAVSA